MKRILRRLVKIDPDGRVRSFKAELLTDYEDGTVEELHVASILVCEACGRLVEELGDVRPACLNCGRSTCRHCGEHHCAVCHRPYCVRCRVGFVAGPLSVCGRCLPTLEHQQARQERLVEDKVAFERLMSVYAAQMKLLQLCMGEKGSIPEFLARVLQLRTTRKLARLERQVRQEHQRDRRLLS